MMKFLEKIPPFAIQGKCIANGDRLGRCVLLADIDDIPRNKPGSIVIGERAIRGAATRFGMVDETILAAAQETIIRQSARADAAEARVAELEVALRTMQSLNDPPAPTVKARTPKVEVSA